ncbi:hypothetical protein MHU86_17396 [Fragilaria crotonensis]|nr:hypothetical protein MHU86_17396 [Fragilaria crotonensis]
MEAAAIAFALAPAQAVDGPLDYSRAEHHKIYRSGIRSITDDPFPCDADRLLQFLREVQDRAMEMGWMDGILNVTTNPGEDEPEEENMLENYGTITLEQVIASERTYIAEQQRKAQDTYMLYQCLMASLTSEAKKKVMIWADQYQVEIDGARYNSGVALLKIVIRETSNIGKFNQYGKLLIQSLSARNQTTSDLLINLFKGYGAVSDETFRAWLTRKQDDHEEGNEISPDDLMISAKNKYDAMVEKGTWNAPTAEEKIVALEAKLTSTMKNLNKKVSFEMGKKGGSAGKKTGDKSKHAGKDGGKGDHPKSWPPPKPGEKKVAKFKDYTWYWCGKDTGGTCEKWRAHKPKDCRGGAPPPNKSEGGAKRPASSENKDGKKGIAKKLKIAKAYVAKMEQKVAEQEAASSDDNSN